MADILAVLFFDPVGMHYYPKNPKNPLNDKLVLSKGHGCPALYAAWAEAGNFDKQELLKLRKIDSILEGHPTFRIPFIDVATGSLGQGICMAAGMAYSIKYLEKRSNKIFCILGDGEMSEGSVWEAMQFAHYYKLNNFITIVDVNQLGQSQNTPYKYDMQFIEGRFKSFGAHTQIIDGHNISEIISSIESAREQNEKPTVIVAKTIKGKNLTPEVEDKQKFHGVPLQGDVAKNALQYLESLDLHTSERLFPIKPDHEEKVFEDKQIILPPLSYKIGDKIATRKVYGNILKLMANDPRIVALDGDVKNSTFSKDFFDAFPEKSIECFISEQNMVGVGIGVFTRGYIPFISTFAAFHTRAYDFIRMSVLSNANVKFVGSHAGVHIGADGPSQMGLEDFAMMRSIPNSICFYPSDAVSTAKALEIVANHKGISYIRTGRNDCPVIYSNDEKFEIGKSKVFKGTEKPICLVIGAGVTFNEAMKAQEALKNITVIDLFCVKPIDKERIINEAKECGGKIITVEDHYLYGGIYEAVCSSIINEPNIRVIGLGIKEIPRSGEPDELIDKYQISSKWIIDAIKKINQ